MFPIYIGALSAGLFLLHTILLSTSVRRLLYPPRADDPEPENPRRPENESNIHVSLWAELKENVKSNGGIVIWSFKVFRLLGVLVLIALSVASAINEPQPAHESTLLDMFRGKKRKRKGGKSPLTDTELIELAWVAFYVNSLCLFGSRFMH